MYRSLIAKGLALVFVALTAFVPAASADDSAGSAAIVNGVVTAGEASTGALLFVGPDIKNQFLDCSGVLLGCRTFLTAAQCLCDDARNASACKDGPLGDIDVADLRVYMQHAGIYHVREVQISPNYIKGIRGDLALLRLSQRVDGIEPARINTKHRPEVGSAAVIAGFGDESDQGKGEAIKRSGDVKVTNCVQSVFHPANACWKFLDPIGRPGESSNICAGDAGGPMFAQFNKKRLVTAIHSGSGSHCEANSFGFGTDVYRNRNWIIDAAGSDIERTQCGTLPQVGSSRVAVETVEGNLPKAEDSDYWVFNVPDRGTRLVFTVNGDTQQGADYDIFIKYNGYPTPRDYDCAVRGVGQFGVCTIEEPEPGIWQVLVKHVLQNQARGRSRYQVTATTFRDPPRPGEPPDAPITLRYEFRSEEYIDLTWEDESYNEDGFEIERKLGNEVNEFFPHVVTGDGRERRIERIDTDLIYTYRIRAFNQYGDSDWSNICIVNEPFPRRPLRVREFLVQPRKVKITWQDRSNNESGFRIQRRRVGRTDFKTIGVVGEQVNTFADRRVIPNRVYQYRVRAEGRTDECIQHSNWSPKRTVETPPVG